MPVYLSPRETKFIVSSLIGIMFSAVVFLILLVISTNVGTTLGWRQLVVPTCLGFAVACAMWIIIPSKTKNQSSR